MEAKHGLSHKNFPSPRLTWPSAQPSPHHTSSDDQPLDFARLPKPGGSASCPSGRLIALDSFHHEVGNDFPSLNKHSFLIFIFSCFPILHSSYAICGLTDHLIHHGETSHGITSNKRIHLMIRKKVSGLMPMGFTGFSTYTISPNSRP